MPSWNGDWVSWRTSQGNARIVTWLPTVEIDEPDQKRANVPSRRTDGGAWPAGALRAAAPAGPAAPQRRTRTPEAALPVLATTRSTLPASCRRAAPRGAVGAASRRADRGADP